MATPKAQYLHGEPVMIDFPNGTNAVAAGDVLTASNSVRIAHSDIAASALGALADGGGVYSIAASGSNGGGVPIPDGNLVRWDATNGFAVGGTATNNLKLGYADGAYSTNSATITVRHIPGLNL